MHDVRTLQEKDEDTEDEEAVAELRRVSYVGLARCLNLEQVESELGRSFAKA